MRERGLRLGLPVRLPFAFRFSRFRFLGTHGGICGPFHDTVGQTVHTTGVRGITEAALVSWRDRQDSNLHPPVLETGARPVELRSQWEMPAHGHVDPA
jgi:hypothetical protein